LIKISDFILQKIIYTVINSTKCGCQTYNFSPARFRVAKLSGHFLEKWDMAKYFFFVKKLLNKYTMSQLFTFLRHIFSEKLIATI